MGFVKKNRQASDKIIDFDVNLIKHKEDDSWVEKTLFEIKKYLESDVIPESGEYCDWCAYWNTRKELEN